MTADYKCIKQKPDPAKVLLEFVYCELLIPMTY